MSGERKRLHLWVPAVDRDRVERLSAASGMNMTEVICDAVRLYEQFKTPGEHRIYNRWLDAMEGENVAKKRERPLFMVLNPDGTIEAFGG